MESGAEDAAVRGRAGEGTRGVTAIIPYYRSEDGAVTVYNERWEDVRDAGLVVVKDIALVHADGPYGIGVETDGVRHVRGGLKPVYGRDGKERGTPQPRTFPKIEGDDKPFDPAPVLSLDRPTVMWGANCFSSRLPDMRTLYFWDKRDDSGSDDGGDGEVAWSNLGGPIRRFVHLWRGTCRASETGTAHLWGTQKPEALMGWVLERARESRRCKLRAGQLLFVPYMGSFPDYRPAVALGLRVIACDVHPEACRVALAARIRAVSQVAPKASIGPLFGSAT